MIKKIWINTKKKAGRNSTGRKVSTALLLAFSAAFLLGCASSKPDQRAGQEKSNQAGREKIKVVTTIFPQYDFVREIAGDRVDLKMLLKPGEESHSYEPTPKDIIDIQNCDLFVYVGGENDAWVDDILASMDSGDRKTLRLVDCVDTVKEEHVKGMKEERHEENEEAHGGELDEHVWTSPKNAVRIVEKLSELLCEADPKDAEEFRASAREYEKKLKNLDRQFRKIVEESLRHTLLFGDRFPFRYFVEEYGLDYYAAFPGCASDTEPSASTMAFLINKGKEEKIPVVLKMELSNDQIAKAVAEATGAKVKVFYSCHNITAEQFKEHVTYLDMMEKNLETLKEALADGTD